MHRSKLKIFSIKQELRRLEQLEETEELLCKCSSQYQERLLSKTEYKRFDR